MENWLKDLQDVKKVFDKHGTKFFLTYGTALGAYREGQFIEGDYDIDLGSFDPTHREEIKLDLEKLGFQIGVCYNVLDKTEIPSKMILSERNVRVDIFFFEKKEGEYVAWKHDFTEYPFYAMPLKFNKTAKVFLYDEPYNILTPTPEYLEYFYGDWKTPSKTQAKLYSDIHNLPKTKF